MTRMPQPSTTAVQHMVLADVHDSWIVESSPWEAARERLLAAVAPEQRAAVERLLSQARYSGFGLRAWADRIAVGATDLPERLPAELVQVYIDHSEAMPEHDCAGCGVAVPVIPSRQSGHEDDPDRVFFAECPCCGARTGRYLYWGTAHLRRAKPR